MPDTTTIQSLPLIQPSQAQKHVTHNEALKLIDVMIQLSVVNRTLTLAPAAPVPGQSHIVAAGATGLWAGQAGRIAVFTGSVWEFFTPRNGWLAWLAAEAQLAVYTGTGWAANSDGPAVFGQLGVSATPDATNRLAVSSPASLLNHAGAGHQLKINKAAATDTASLLFQTGFSGRAEMGTVGSDDFSVKVSADGATFFEGLVIDSSSGRVRLMNGLAVNPAAGEPAAPVDGDIWYNAASGKFRARQGGISVDVLGAVAAVFSDSAFRLQDNGDPTRQAQFELSGIATATTRTMTLPDASGTLVLAAATQTLTNKTIALGANTITGTLAAAQEPAHTGDVTNPAGSLALAIAPNAVTNAKLAPMAAGTIKGNNTGAAAAPVDLTAAQVKAVLAIAAADVSGLGALALAGSVSLSTQASGVLQAAQEPAHTGDVTNPAGSLALSIAPNAVTLAQMAQVSSGRFLGRSTAAAGNVEALTAAQATAMLSPFGAAAQGVVPASGGGTTTFLRADGTWVAPAGGGGAPGGSTAQIQFNNAGAFAGASEVLVENNQLRLTAAASLTAPAAGGARLVGRSDAGRVVPAFLSQDGVLRDVQSALARSSPMIWKAQAGAGTLTVLGGAAPTAVGTATAANTATTNLVSYTPRLEFLVAVAATTAIAGFRGTNPQVTVGGPSAGLGGFHFTGRWGPATGVATTTNRAFFGLAALTSAPTDVQPSTAISAVFMGWDAADSNLQMMTNDASGTCTKVDLGASFPVPVTDRTALYELAMYAPGGTVQSVAWQVTDLVSGAVASGTITTDLPAATTLLAPRGWISVGGTSSVIGLGLNSLVLDPLL